MCLISDNTINRELLAVGKTIEVISKISSVYQSEIQLHFYKYCFITTTAFLILQRTCDALL